VSDVTEVVGRRLETLKLYVDNLGVGSMKLMVEYKVVSRKVGSKSQKSETKKTGVMPSF
jgi:hypothetical protein